MPPPHVRHAFFFYCAIFHGHFDCAVYRYRDMKNPFNFYLDTLEDESKMRDLAKKNYACLIKVYFDYVVDRLLFIFRLI